MSQTHIPKQYRDDPAMADRVLGRHWRRPRLLCDVEALELIFDPPKRILTIGDMRKYQRWMSDLIIDHGAVYLGAEMGLGKTGASLYAAVQLLDAGSIRKVLIVAPLNVAENTWPDEIATWAFSRHLEYSVITGDLDERIAALRADAQVYIINREQLPWLQKWIGSSKWDFDMLIYDEASRLKQGNKKTESARISEFGVLSRMRYKFKHVVLLSGTPAPNGLIDLWGPIYICDKGERLGSSITAYRNRWFRYDMFTRKYDPFDHSHEEIMGRLKGLFYSLRAADYLELPPLIFQDHAVTLPPKAMEIYRRMEREMALEEWDIEAVNNGVLINKLLQLANGSIYQETGESVRVHDAKLDVLDSIITENMGQPILLAYSYQFDCDAIKKRFPFARIFGEGKYDVRDWNAGKIRLMLTHPASAGHGMNFQHGGNQAVWYGMNWSLELYLQFLKRLHRPGQTAEKVICHRILAKNTADYNVLDTINRKEVQQDDITEAVRVRWEGLRRTWRMAA